MTCQLRFTGFIIARTLLSCSRLVNGSQPALATCSSDDPGARAPAKARLLFQEALRQRAQQLDEAHAAKKLWENSVTDFLQEAAHTVQDPTLFGGNFLVAVLIFACMVTTAVYAAISHRWEERTRSQSDVSQAALTALEDAYFTPDLVVPDGCECILLLHSKPAPGQISEVTDASGGIVLRIADTETSSLPRRKLLSPQSTLLGQCGRARGSLPAHTSASICFEIMGSNLDVYARLTYQPRQGADDKCIIETKFGQKLLLFGSIQHQTTNLADMCGRLLATTEPVTQQGPRGEEAGSLLRLRVAPLADVGLVLCCLMCVQTLSSPNW
mmetsp:Transcript_4053/g.7375  ORF Transcript_4053/g.7375 Transcript_4053/m.7375 type:complete len:327 (+) Transcript_4053:111-1091(+)